VTIREKILLEGEDRASQAFQKAGGGFEAMGATLKKVALTGGIFIAAQKLLELGQNALKSAIDAREAASAFDTTFGAAVGEASAFVEEFAIKAGFATGELKQLLAITGNVVQGIGATEQESAELAESMARLAGDVASFSNAAGGAPAVLQALQSAINGEREALKTYGLAISEVEVQELALQQTQKERAEDLTRLEKAQATVDLAYEKAGKAVGDLDRTHDSAANTLRRVQARAKEAGAAFGEELLPSVEELLPALEALIPVAGNVASSLSGAFTAVAPAIGKALSGADELFLGIQLAANSAINVVAGLGAIIAEVGSLGLVDTSWLQATAESAAASNDLAQAIYETNNAVRAGRDAGAAYADGLLFLSNQGSLTADAVNELATAIGVDAEVKALALYDVFAYADAHGTAAEDVGILARATEEAQAAAGMGGLAQMDAARHTRDHGEAAAEAAPLIDELAEAEKAAAEEAAKVRAEAIKTADAFKDDLAAGVTEFLTGFEKAPDQIKTTLDEWEANFTTRLETQQAFWANLKILAEAGLTDLAEEVRAQGPEAAGFVEDLVGDMEEAARLDTLISNAEGDMKDVTGAYADALQLSEDDLTGDLEAFGGTLIEAIIRGAGSISLGQALRGVIVSGVEEAIGGGTGAGRAGAPRPDQRYGNFQSGTWNVPGSPSEAVNATVHGTEIIIPPAGSTGRGDFARELATEFARLMPTGTDGRGPVHVNIERLITPEGTTVNEAIAAGTAEALIESLLS
jgi:hypothetical protein